MFYLPYNTTLVDKQITIWDAISASGLSSRGYTEFTVTFGDGTSASQSVASSGAPTIFRKTYTTPGTYTIAVSAVGVSGVDVQYQNIDVYAKYDVIGDNDWERINFATLTLPHTYQEIKVGSNKQVESTLINQCMQKLDENTQYLLAQLEVFDNNITPQYVGWYGHAAADPLNVPLWHTPYTSDIPPTSSVADGVVGVTNVYDIMIRKNPLGVPVTYTISNNKIQARIDNSVFEAAINTSNLQRGLVLNNPTAIKSGDSALYVLDGNSNVVYKLKYDIPSKTFIIFDGFGAFGVGENQLMRPSDLDVLNHKIAIADTGNQRVVVLDEGFRHRGIITHGDWALDPIVSVKYHPTTEHIWVMTKTGSLYVADTALVVNNVIKNIMPTGLYSRMSFTAAGDLLYVVSQDAVQKCMVKRDGTDARYFTEVDRFYGDPILSVYVDEDRRLFVGTSSKIKKYNDPIKRIVLFDRKPNMWSTNAFEIDRDKPVLSWVYQNSMFKIASNVNEIIKIMRRRMVRVTDFNDGLVYFGPMPIPHQDEVDYLNDDLNSAPNINEPISSAVINRGIKLIYDKQVELLNHMQIKRIIISTQDSPHRTL